ncbi:MAG: hypothetical protein R3E01_28600 [Pirellulaceae bacterium]|nr:hypothetical protein [Planctomycetales bacterium]
MQAIKLDNRWIIGDHNRHVISIGVGFPDDIIPDDIVGRLRHAPEGANATGGR